MSAPHVGRPVGRLLAVTTTLVSRRRAALLLAAGAAGVGAACNEDFVTGPRDNAVTLELAGWADTVVLGDARTLRVRVLDARGREVVGVATQLDVATAAGSAAGAAGAAVLEARLNAAGASTARLAVTSATDSIAVAAARPGTAGVVLTLLDPRFTTTAVQKTATVVVAGVRAATAHDTTLTALGDTAIAVATALARQGTGPAADYLPAPAQGVTWTRRGSGAVQLVGTGDSVRVVAAEAGVDTLVATHARCLAGARCADTTVVHVGQSAVPLNLRASVFRAWSLGDSIAPSVVLQDARGNAIADARLHVVPLTAADSAVVDPSGAAPAALPRFSRASAAGGMPAAVVTPASTARLLAAPIVLVAHGTARRGATPSAAPSRSVAPVAAPTLVARANGTARVAVEARTSAGALLASDTVEVVVRQVAQQVRVAPGQADLTPGDSIPVMVSATDARGYLIADATFAPVMDGAIYRNGRIIVPDGAPAGRATLAANVVGVAQPTSNPGAPIADPQPDSSRVMVRVAAPVAAGDTAAGDPASAPNALATTVLGDDGRPVAGVWVRFRVPAGSIQGSDSVQTDANGVAAVRWTLPTVPGTYTATAVRLGGPTPGGAPADSAGRIVLRRTATVVAGAPAALALAAAPGPTATLGVALAPAPVVQLRDQYGNPVRAAGIPVTVSVAGPSGLALTGGITVPTDADGQARFAAVVGSGPAGAYTLQLAATTTGATPVTLTPVTTAPITFVAGALHAGQSTLALSAPSVASGTTITVTVTPKDADGNPVGAGHTVGVAVPAAPAAGVATATVSAVTDAGDGTYTATLTGVRAGTPLPVSATVDGAALTTTSTLAVTAGAPATMTVVAGQAQNAQVGTTVATPPRVRVEDAAGNPVPGTTVTFAVTGGGGSLTNGTPTTNGQGEAAPTSWRLGSTAGAQSLSAAVGAVQTTITATAIAVPTAVVVTPGTASIATLGSTRRIEAQVRDANGTALIGFPVSWVSLAPATARVDSAGTRPDGTAWADVTGLANGAASLRATSGALQGTSAITVRQVATEFTVNAPPGPLKMGETTPLAVAAEDSSGNTVPAAHLTYSSSDPSVATVDTLGRVRGIRPGTTVITVTSGGVTTTRTVTVPVSGQFAYADFCTLDGLNLSGSTAQSGCAMRLTPNIGNQTGGIWQPAKQKLDGGFESTVTFRITGSVGGGADGIALVIQSTSNTATGEAGGGIGYPGLTNALAVELDTYYNDIANGEPDGNHVAIQSCGAGSATWKHNVGCTPGAPVTVPFSLKDGQVHTLRVVYTPGTMQIYFDGRATPTLTAAVTLTSINGASILDAQGKAWIGFTAATGGSANNHDILSWSLTPSP